MTNPESKNNISTEAKNTRFCASTVFSGDIRARIFCLTALKSLINSGAKKTSENNNTTNKRLGDSPFRIK
jgi:hypothetical protein